MKHTKRILGFLLTVGMLITSIPVSAFEKPENAQDTLHDGYASTEDKYAIYPIPRSEVYTAGNFTLGTNVTVVSEDGIDNYTNQFLDEILSDYNRTKTASQTITEGTNQILLGIKGSGDAVDTWADSHLTLSDAQLFTKTDAYLLNAEDGRIVILGKDTNAVYHALATLQMMFSSFNGSKFLNVQIEDYAGMKMRGFIEGFYGGWNYEGRESLMRFARDFKMNTYIYASKTDNYHKNDELYPTDQINQIKELVLVGDETKVKYCWSIHISYLFDSLPNDIQSQEYQTKFNEKFERLKAKFQQLYDAGVRKFAILNDDFGSGTHSEVVRLLNKLDDEFLVPKGCDNLTYCMQGYNKAWSGNGSELNEMKALNESIDLFWTGDDVNSPITQDTIDFVKEKTGHEAVFWLNYPVNEHAKSGVYLGEISHYVRDDVTGLAGAVSNPSCLTEANKVGLFQLAALFWNNHNYLAQAETIWEESFKYLQPEVYESYLTIARNAANCPNSGRVPAGFPESEYIKESIDAITNKIKKGNPISDDSDTRRLINEFSNMQTAVDTFRKDCTNEVLKSDLDPWLNSLVDVATAGEAILKSLTAMEQGDLNEAWSNLSITGAAMGTWDTYTYIDGKNNTQYAKSGSKRLVPFINKALSAAKKNILPLLNPDADTPVSYLALIHGVDESDSAEFLKAFDGNAATVATFRTNDQQAGDYFGIDLGKATLVHSIDILQGSDDSDHNFYHNTVLECSNTGKDDDWTELLKYENDSSPRHIEKTYEDDSLTTRFIRLRLTKRGTAGKADYWTHIREFTINGGETKTEEPSYGLYASDGIDGNVTLEGLTYSITNTSVSLPSDGYIGIKMQKLSAIDTVVCDIEGASDLDFQYSMNGLVWTDMPETPNKEAARYIRLYNRTGQTAEFSIKTLSVTALAGAVKPYLYSNSPELNTLHEGAIANMFDGNNETYAWFKPAIKEGFELVVDFGTIAPIYDISITNEEGNPKFYDAEIYLSTDNSNWGSPVITITNSQSEHLSTNGKFMTFSRNDLQGRNARYMKILITKDSPNQVRLKINEIAVNKTVSSSDENIGSILTNTLTGALDQMIDGDISTAYISSQPSDGTAYIKYPITEKTKLTTLTLLQNSTEITNAQVKAEIFDGQTTTEKVLGTLNAGITSFYFDGSKDILSITVTWPNNTTPTLYEIITNTDEVIHSISFRGEGAPSDSLICPENRFILLPDATITKEGYVFMGWSDGTTVYPPNRPFTMGTTDITLNAEWAKDIQATSISVTPSSAELKVGETKELQYSILPENAVIKDAVWSSNNPSIAMVDEKSGLVTAQKAGTAIITATTTDGSNLSDTCTITITRDSTTPNPVLVSSIVLESKELELFIDDDPYTLSAEIKPENASNKKLNWSSDDEKIASVDSVSGTITPHATGTVTITATSTDGSNVSDSCTVKITDPDIIFVESITITPQDKTLAIGEEIMLQKTIIPASADNQEVEWSSDKESVASVTSDGKVKALSAGTAVITASSKDGSNITGKCTITVTDAVDINSITITPAAVNLKTGETKQLAYTVEPENATDKTITWNSNNTAVATVTESGLITAIAKGEATITASAAKDGSVPGTCKVIVTENTVSTNIKITSITVSPKSANLKIGTAKQLIQTVLPANATNKAVTWTSNKPSVASVSQSGLVRAVSAGTAAITVTAKDGSQKSAVCTITVTGNNATLPEAEEGKTYDSENCLYTVTSLSKQTAAFAGIKDINLKKVTIPDTVTIGTKTFTVTSIEKKALKNKKRITSVIIGKNIESIGSSAFEGCSKLKTVTMKSSRLKEIGSKTFYKCKALNKIKILSKKLKKVGKNALKGIAKKATIHVPSSKFKQYKKLLAKKGQGKSVKIKK